MTGGLWNCGGLISRRLPPENRRGYCSSDADGYEFHFTEAAVMLAVAMHMFRDGATRVELHPDGEHAKRFEIVSWLEAHNFTKTASFGSTAYGGTYARDGRSLIVAPTSGQGDVIGMIGGQAAWVECKGGVINSRHAGVTSRLRTGLQELIGILMARPEGPERQIAVIPFSSETVKQAMKLAPRARKAGIEIALVSDTGELTFVAP